MLESFKVSDQSIGKKVMRYVIARVKDDLLASEIAKQIDVLQAIEWVAKAWKEVTVETIKNVLSNMALLRKRVKLRMI